MHCQAVVGNFGEELDEQTEADSCVHLVFWGAHIVVAQEHTHHHGRGFLTPIQVELPEQNTDLPRLQLVGVMLVWQIAMHSSRAIAASYLKNLLPRRQIALDFCSTRGNE